MHSLKNSSIIKKRETINLKRETTELKKVLIIVTAVIITITCISGCAETDDIQVNPIFEYQPENGEEIFAWTWIKIIQPEPPEKAAELPKIKTNETKPEFIPETLTPKTENPKITEELVYKQITFTAPKFSNPSLYNGEEKLIALTFDDGPSIYTDALLDTLIENESAATFFVLGQRTQTYKQAIIKMAENGSEVAGHSWSHRDLRTLGYEDIKNDLQTTNTAIFELTEIRPTIHRVPYGAFNDNVKNASLELGMAMIQWNLDPRDWQVRNADTVYNNIMSTVKHGSIIVLHDIHATTVEAMKRVIPDLIDAGFKLITVSELLQTIEPGIIYSGGK